MNEFGAISEAFQDLFECARAVSGEEVGPMHRWKIIKSDEGVKTSFALRAFERVVADSRSDALKQVLAVAADSLDEVYEISIQECED